MSNPHYVIAHGRRILVDTLNPAPSTKRQKAKQEAAFVLVPLARAAVVTKRLRASGTMVWIILLYMAWKTKGNTFPLPNTLLARYGVSRETKRRALAKLEASDLIEIKKSNRRAPVVTLKTVT